MKVKTTTINGNSYQITQFDAFTGNSILKTLKDSFVQSLSEAAAFAANIYSEDTDNAGENQFLERMLDSRELFTKALIDFGANMKGNEYSEFCLHLLSNTLLNAKPIEHGVFRTHFAGNYEELYKILFEVVRFNFEDFFLAMFSTLVAGQTPTQTPN